jgi:hypothetical protein
MNNDETTIKDGNKQVNAGHFLRSTFLDSYFKISFLLLLDLASGSFLRGLLTKVMYPFLLPIFLHEY